MSALHARDIEWRPAWMIARVAHLARLRTALVGCRDPLVRALVDEIRRLLRWRRYAEAERQGLLEALRRRDVTIQGWRQAARAPRPSEPGRDAGRQSAQEEAPRDRRYGGSGRVPTGGPETAVTTLTTQTHTRHPDGRSRMGSGTTRRTDTRTGTGTGTTRGRGTS